MNEIEVIERKERNIKWASVFAYIVISIAVGVLSITFYWLNADNQPLVIKNQPTPIKNKTVSTTGYLIANYDYCKNTTADGDLRISFVSDKSEIFLPLVKERSLKQCKNINAPFIIPPQVTPGMYHLKFRVTYQVNPLKSVVITWESENFNVVE